MSHVMNTEDYRLSLISGFSLVKQVEISYFAKLLAEHCINELIS